jgi:hypothetical protein
MHVSGRIEMYQKSDTCNDQQEQRRQLVNLECKRYIETFYINKIKQRANTFRHLLSHQRITKGSPRMMRELRRCPPR